MNVVAAIVLIILLLVIYGLFVSSKQFPYRASGTEKGQRQLLGPQTTGREYRNLSQPKFDIVNEFDLEIPLRDGIKVRADLYRPKTDQPVPVLVAASPYPRQLQYLSAPAAFIEAGQTDFWVPRGYAHLIVNIRGTFGSEGEYRFVDTALEQDLYDVIEWVAKQPWCDGNVGMIGVSYFSMVQYRAALANPPHLKAIFPFSGATDVYRQFAYHGGIFSARFLGSYFSAVGSLEHVNSRWFRSRFLRLINNVILHRSSIHRKFAQPLKAPMNMLERICLFPYRRQWEDNYQDIAREHVLYDAYWANRDLTTRLSQVNIPMYLGSDPRNVTVHTDGPYAVLPHLRSDQTVRVLLSPPNGLQWPWESFHMEALAWYDHWLKHKDTGILEGPFLRYYVEGANEWRESDCWPPENTMWRDFFLDQSGGLMDHFRDGYRDYAYTDTNEPRGRNTILETLPQQLVWDTSPFARPVEVIGPSVLHLVASSTATDTDWILKISDIAPNGVVTDLTQGWLRASHRTLDENRSTDHRPVHSHTVPEPLIPGAQTTFKIPILPIAHRFHAGHMLRLAVTSRDDDLAMQGQSHSSLRGHARNRIFGLSRLSLSINEV